MSEYLYVTPALDRSAIIASDALDDTTERHKAILHIEGLAADSTPLRTLEGHAGAGGMVIGLANGIPGRGQLRLAARALRRGQRVWFYWPSEQVVECVDRERVRSLWRHWFGILSLDRVGRPMHRLVRVYRDAFPIHRDVALNRLARMRLDARPVPFRASTAAIDANHRLGGGLYLRTDFWTTNISGGSYGHTCYVAKELAAVTGRFACLLTQHFSLLDQFGVQQVRMDPPPIVEGEDAIITAPDHYYPIAKAACQLLRPDFIYERLCLGNYVAAALSHELQIPYIIEYNGSEISMQRSFDSSALYYEDVYLKTEEVAFRQATMISVISAAVRNDLVARGVDAGKILVNPNGADLDSYAPAAPEARREIRTSLGFGDADRVVGFTGTFGGWHGIDVLAAAIPRICAGAPQAKFLIIGDGQHKPALDAEVARHHLDDRVRCVGRVTQVEGAKLLKACDLYVSPHNAHMVDSKFFGSPTKIFEYMAMGGGIVASDLEQIGEVLSPALRVGDVLASAPVTDQRAVLCTPGDVDDFVAAVISLVERPALCQALGRNARQAVADHYSWKQHVARLWSFADRLPRDSGSRPIETGDSFKDQVQNQWNNSPVGSEGARQAQPHTLEWFLEVERHRYDEYAPWMPAVMEFADHGGHDVLEIGGGLGTDLAQFAKHGARVTDVDLSEGHLRLAEENFRRRGLNGRFVHHDAESLPFDSGSFDLVYSNGVLHHTPNTARAIDEIRRVLRPGGRVIAMFYAENSLQYWRNLVWHFGVMNGELSRLSMGDILSRRVERSGNEARPLVKVYTKARLRAMFKGFTNIQIVQRQISADLIPARLRRLMPLAEKLAGWNLIIKATRPRA